MMGSFLERPIIQKDFKNNYQVCILQYKHYQYCSLLVLCVAGFYTPFRFLLFTFRIGIYISSGFGPGRGMVGYKLCKKVLMQH